MPIKTVWVQVLNNTIILRIIVLLWITPYNWRLMNTIQISSDCSSLLFKIINCESDINFLCKNNNFVKKTLTKMRYKKVRFEVLTVTSMKMTTFWDVASCSLVDTDWHCRVYCLHHRHQNAWCNIPEDSHLLGINKFPAFSTMAWKYIRGKKEYLQTSNWDSLHKISNNNMALWNLSPHYTLFRNIMTMTIHNKTQ
jgi:hypothetical protein